MLFEFDIPDESLRYLLQVTKRQISTGYNPSFTLDRYDSAGSAHVSCLIGHGVISPTSYYGGAICYNPSYRLTKLGELVRNKAVAAGLNEDVHKDSLQKGVT